MKEKTFYRRYILTFKTVKEVEQKIERHSIDKLLNLYNRNIMKGSKNEILEVIDPKSSNQVIRGEENIGKFIREHTTKSPKLHDLREKEKIEIE